MTDGGIEIDFNEVQAMNDFSPINVTDGGIKIIFNDVQFEKR